MATGVLLTSPILQFFGNNGAPAVNGSVLTQIASVNAATFQDVALTTPLPNPIPLNSRGEVSTSNGVSSQCFLTPNTVYTFTLYDGPNSTGNQIWSASYVNGVQVSITQAGIAQLLNPQTAAENLAGVTPVNYIYQAGNMQRYGADPTGTVDSTAAFNACAQAIWAMYQYPDGQLLWNGGGGANPVMLVPPGKYLITGTIFLPCAMTITAAAHPSNTTNHTRLIMNSTGLTPARVWAAATTIITGSRINAGNGANFVATTGGVTGGVAPTWPGTGTVADGTVVWTYSALNTAGDNRNVPMFKFQRGTKPGIYNAATNPVIADSATVITFQQIEIWYVTVGATFSNPLSGSGYAVGDYPLGAAIAFDVDAADCRIVDCSFQACPSAIWGLNVTSSSATRGDGFTGNRGIGLFIENTEFDAASSHIFMRNCALTLFFKGCQFFNSSSFYGGCTGTINYQDCYFQNGALIPSAFIDAGILYGVNTFASFIAKGNIVEPPANFPWVYLNQAAFIDISQNSLTVAATIGGITVFNDSAGSISNNAMVNQGFSAPAGSGPTNYVAAINIQYCTNLKVSDNVIGNTVAGTYGGFGIYSNAGTYNFISNNAVTTPFNGANVNSQGRRINITSTDVRGLNYEVGVGQQQVLTGQTFVRRVSLPYGVTVTPDASQSIMLDVTATNTTAFTIANPLNPQDGQEIEIMVRNAAGAALGVITWGASYKMLGFTSPISGGSCTIRFRYDSVNWVQTMPQTAQVPN